MNLLCSRSQRSSKIVGKRLWSSRIHSKTGTTCKEWKSQRRTSRELGNVSISRWNKKWHRRKKLEIPMETTIPYKMKTKKLPEKSGETDDETKVSNKIPKTKCACIVGTHESTRNRLESALSKESWRSHRGKRFQFNKSSQFGKFVPMFQAMSCSEQKKCEKLEKLSAC